MIPNNYRQFITALPWRNRYAPADLLVPDLLISSDSKAGLEIYYAPVDWINQHARIAIVGVTPGFTQMELAIRVARRELESGADLNHASKAAKYAASFAGTMRSNLTAMLLDLNIRHLLGPFDDLFGDGSHLLHTTSVVRYPTFVEGRNYTGSHPPLLRTEVLMRYARELLAPELCALRNACFLPLGTAVESVLIQLEAEGLVPQGQTLTGFPHPSGANGHRRRQFSENRIELQAALSAALR